MIFDQAVRSYAHFQPGLSVVKGLHNGFGPHFSVLGDHWSPILASLAPLYWIFNSPETLLVAQAVLFALAVPPLWLFTRRAFGGGRKATAAAYLVSVAYGLSWPIASAAAFDFHEVAFAPVLMAVALERLQAGRLRTALRLVITPRVKLDTMLWLLAPFCFLPLLSPITIAVIPLLLERMLQNQFSNWWLTAYHYNAYLVIILACGAVDGAARLDRWARRARQDRALAGTTAWARADRSAGMAALVSAAAICAVTIFLVPGFALGPALHPSFYQRNAEETAAAAAVAAVPSGVTVEAVNRLGPHLSGRDTVLLWDGDGGFALYPPWVPASVVGRQFTFHSVKQQEQRIALLRKHGYKTIFERGGFIVLHSPDATTSVAGSAEKAG